MNLLKSSNITPSTVYRSVALFSVLFLFAATSHAGMWKKSSWTHTSTWKSSHYSGSTTSTYTSKYVGDCALDDVTFGVQGESPSNADDCFGPIEDNDDASYFDTHFSGFGWEELIKLDDIDNSKSTYSDDGIFNDIAFTLTGEKDSSDDWKDGGSWSLSWEGDALPATVDLAVGLKAGNAFSGYLFDDVYLTEQNSPGAGDWEISFQHCKVKSSSHSHTRKCGCNTNDLSHFSLYIRDMVSVPAPEALSLMGLGLIGLVLVRRKSA